MIPLTAGWSDIGSWRALWEADVKDESGNVLRGDVIALDTGNSYVTSTGPLLATLGVDDLLCVATEDAVLVADKRRGQDVKRVVAALGARDRKEHLEHRRIMRPWGWYQDVDRDDRFRVKRICVKPGATLSLQMHHHRAEHWIVVRGTAEVTRGEDVFLLTENQSAYIPLGAVHRLANPGKLPLHIVEVQSGAYLEENDIVRFEDVYGRQNRNEDDSPPARPAPGGHREPIS